MQQPKIPDDSTRERLIKQLRQTNRSFELLNLELAEDIATIETSIRQQRRKYLEAKN